tara:strand:- start:2244 stop:2423 length:180 start_codon:yes stop_codon:yes gene_type:complete
MRTLKKNKNKNKKEKRARHKTQASAMQQKIPFFSQKVHTTHNTTEGLRFHGLAGFFVRR